jgi:predicted Zn-dependent protease
MFRLLATLLAVALAIAQAAAAPLESVAAELVAREGGIYRDARVAAYVRKVGLRVLAAAEAADSGWRFDVLDTPVPNAFALPGGRVFVTRGMLALVGDEAELAAVLGHEIGHSLAGHGLASRGGASERERRSAEFAADRLGMRLLAAAGYDPRAQADYLATLAASRALDARLGGGAVRGAAGDHPAIAARQAAARREAARLPSRGVRNRDAYLDAIDGLTWGDGPSQGYARGRTFLHPGLGFAFEAPPDYLLANHPNAVVASGPRGAVFLLDSRPDPGGSPAGYLARGWVPEIARQVRTGPVEDLRRTVQHGLAAAEGRVDLTGRNSRRVAELTVVRLDGRFFRLTGLHAPGDRAASSALDAAAASFRALPPSEARALRPLRLRIHRISGREDLAAVVDDMPVAAPRPRFETLNGLSPGEPLRAGDRVKLIE